MNAVQSPSMIGHRRRAYRSEVEDAITRGHRQLHFQIGAGRQAWGGGLFNSRKFHTEGLPLRILLEAHLQSFRVGSCTLARVPPALAIRKISNRSEVLGIHHCVRMTSCGEYRQRKTPADEVTTWSRRSRVIRLRMMHTGSRRSCGVELAHAGDGPTGRFSRVRRRPGYRPAGAVAIPCVIPVDE